MTKDEKRHLQRVADFGCIVCRNVYFRKTAAEIHHIRAGQGMAQRASHFETIPLCPRHHRTGGYGVAIHAGQAAWEEAYGTELELLEQVRGMLAR